MGVRNVYVESITPVVSCGNVVLYQTQSRFYETPYETEPTTGEHDFTTCEGCQETMLDIETKLTTRFNGEFEDIPAFPDCCEYHAELKGLAAFTIDDFRGVPQMTARKIIYTKQHIKNNHARDDYYKYITDYIDYTICSFGQMPNKAMPLYLDVYYEHIIDYLENHGEEIATDRKTKLLKYIGFYRTPAEKVEPDLDAQIAIYEKWVSIFPFELRQYFGNIKSTFESHLPYLHGPAEVNIFSGVPTFKAYTKQTLVQHLCDLTIAMLRKVNTHQLVAHGIIPDINRHQFELAGAELRFRDDLIFKEFSQDESRYVQTIQKWLDNQRIYFGNITPLLGTLALGTPKEQWSSLNTHLSPSQCEQLHEELTRDGYFMPADTSKDHFCFAFGNTSNVDGYAPLQWNRSKNALYELIELLNDGMVSNQQKKDTGKLFLNNQGKPIGKLPNPHKDQFSSDRMQLETITDRIKTRPPQQ